MDAEIKKAWIEALRSGKYKQGKSSLCRTLRGVDRFCCLGVLADVAIEDDWVPYKGSGYIGWLFDGMAGLLSDGCLEQVGLNNDQMWRLVDMNDSGKSFAAIADYIEANL